MGNRFNAIDAEIKDLENQINELKHEKMILQRNKKAHATNFWDDKHYGFIEGIHDQEIKMIICMMIDKQPYKFHGSKLEINITNDISCLFVLSNASYGILEYNSEDILLAMVNRVEFQPHYKKAKDFTTHEHFDKVKYIIRDAVNKIELFTTRKRYEIINFTSIRIRNNDTGSNDWCQLDMCDIIQN